VAENYPGRVVFDAAQSDDAAPFQFGGSTRHGKALHIKVERGLGVLHKNVLLPPVPERLRRTRVPVVSRMVAGVLFPQDDTHQVVRAGSIVAILHLRGDLVVRLGDNLWDRDPVRVITKRAKGFDEGHG
jgi:hypothetical protein